MGNTLGDFIRQRRKKLGLSQRALAKKADISNTAVYRLEGGEVVPETSTLEALADALGMSLKDLMDIHQGKAVEEDEDPKLSMLFSQLKQLSPAKRQIISEMIEILLKYERDFFNT